MGNVEEIPVDEIEAGREKRRLPAWVEYVGVTLPIVIVIIYLLVSGWGGYVFAYIKCGIRPPQIAYSVEYSQFYYTPDNRRYSAPGEGISFVGYYCTEAQARADGFLRAGP